MLTQEGRGEEEGEERREVLKAITYPEEETIENTAFSRGMGMELIYAMLSLGFNANLKDPASGLTAVQKCITAN